MLCTTRRGRGGGRKRGRRGGRRRGRRRRSPRRRSHKLCNPIEPDARTPLSPHFVRFRPQLRPHGILRSIMTEIRPSTSHVPVIIFNLSSYDLRDFKLPRCPRQRGNSFPNTFLTRSLFPATSAIEENIPKEKRRRKRKSRHVYTRQYA